jgi:hypothetical protein
VDERCQFIVENGADLVLLLLRVHAAREADQAGNPSPEPASPCVRND